MNPQDENPIAAARAYRAFAQALGRTVPDWFDLPALLQEAWVAAARELRDPTPAIEPKPAGNPWWWKDDVTPQSSGSAVFSQNLSLTMADLQKTVHQIYPDPYIKQGYAFFINPSVIFSGGSIVSGGISGLDPGKEDLK